VDFVAEFFIVGGQNFQRNLHFFLAESGRGKKKKEKRKKKRRE